MMRDLSRLLRPRSIAVYGAVWAENVIRTCDRFDFAGDIWPIHPTKAQIGGRPAFTSISELPGAPDAVFLGVNRDLTLKLLPDIRAAGAGGVIIFASGFAERGDGAAQAALVEAAGDMPILGPNCYGVINAFDGAAVWPDEQGLRRVERGVGIISQSSNIAMTLTMSRSGLPVGMLACVGNAAQTGLARIGAAMLADPRISALGLYIEGIGDAGALAELAEQARAAGKGIVAVKSGRSDAARDAAASHTASLAGDAMVTSAFLKRVGIAEVSSLPALVETLKVLHFVGPLDAPRLISVSCSGGEAGLVADAALARDLDFPALTEAGRAALGAALGPGIALANPLDYQTFVWGDEARMTDVFEAALTDMDAGIYVIDPPRADRCDPTGFDPALAAIAGAAARTGKPVFAVTTLPGSVGEDEVGTLAERGVVALAGLDAALEALDGASVPFRADGWRPWAAVDAGETVLLDEAEAKAALSEAGVTVPRSVVGRSLGALDMSGLRAPFALKGLGFAHKSEAGAVRLGLRSLEGQAEIEGAAGYLLEEMLAGPFVEVLVGVRRDPVCGAALTIGTGGVLAELIGDVAVLVCPASEAELRAALAETKVARLLDGWRGARAASTDALVAAVMRVQEMLAGDADLIEVEINPLAVTETEAVALDALMRRRVR